MATHRRQDLVGGFALFYISNLLIPISSGFHLHVAFKALVLAYTVRELWPYRFLHIFTDPSEEQVKRNHQDWLSKGDSFTV
ncbi:unnamed protein product [Ilex paraguariensis]|uniref:Uncharacterized protein n=1 Tax=Ilex paraguariensis TaxID=185542 RepID=A0ABC8R5U3_9AQUA